MKSNDKKGYVLVGIIFILITVVSFVVPTTKTAAFWVAYVFTIIALAVQIVIWKKNIANETMKSKFLGFPVVHIGLVYLTVQVAVLLVFVFASNLPTWSAVLVCVAIAAIAAICMISADVGRTEIERVEKKVQGKVFYIRNLQTDIEILANAEEDKVTKKALEQLAEKIRYSDPMSNEQLAPLEEKIELLADELKVAEEKDEIISRIDALLDERNKKCKIFK